MFNVYFKSPITGRNCRYQTFGMTRRKAQEIGLRLIKEKGIAARVDKH
jgi:hypothetical protein